MPRRPRASTSFLREHSLSLTLAGVLIFLFVMYRRSDPSTHLGALYGNAIADWLGVFVFVIATKYFFEIGSGESNRPTRHFHERGDRFEGRKVRREVRRFAPASTIGRTWRKPAGVCQSSSFMNATMSAWS
jgi:hypothetical protein